MVNEIMVLIYNMLCIMYYKLTIEIKQSFTSSLNNFKQ